MSSKVAFLITQCLLCSHMQRGLEVVEGKGAAEEQLQHDLSRTLALQQLLTLNDISQVSTCYMSSYTYFI